MSIPGFSTISNLINTISYKKRDEDSENVEMGIVEDSYSERKDEDSENFETGMGEYFPDHTFGYIRSLINDQGECPLMSVGLCTSKASRVFIDIKLGSTRCAGTS